MGAEYSPVWVCAYQPGLGRSFLKGFIASLVLYTYLSSNLANWFVANWVEKYQLRVDTHFVEYNQLEAVCSLQRSALLSQSQDPTVYSPYLLHMKFRLCRGLMEVLIGNTRSGNEPAHPHRLDAIHKIRHGCLVEDVEPLQLF